MSAAAATPVARFVGVANSSHPGYRLPMAGANRNR